MEAARRPVCCCIAPPALLNKVAKDGDASQREAAIRALTTSASLRTKRIVVTRLLGSAGLSVDSLAAISLAGHASQTVYDAHHGGSSALPGTSERSDGTPASTDAAVNDVFDHTATTRDYYKAVHTRDSVDDHGLELVSSVHYSRALDNAMWNGEQMLYGDGSGHLFAIGALTRCLDVIAHELTHGVTQFTAQLEYHTQPGALNESFSDVFGSLVKQYSLKQPAAQADWLIGEGTLVPSLGQALRSLERPGTAWQGDNQPAHMSDYVNLPDDGDPANDSGGVHVNSGIPNHAFFLAATKIGGNAWDAPGKIWYETLTSKLRSDASFKDAAEATVEAAGELYTSGGFEQQQVADAWQEVGVLP